MKRELAALLRGAADDRGRPLPFTPRDIVDRGRRRARRRAWGWSSLWAAAAVAVVVILTQLVTRPEAAPFPAPPPAPSTTASATASASTTSAAPVVSAADQQLVDQCARTEIYLPQTLGTDATLPPTAWPTPSPTTSDLTGYRVLLRADDEFGSSAGLISSDGKQYAVCHLVRDASSDHKEELREMPPPQTGSVPSWWTDPAKAYLVDMPFGWSQICRTTATGKLCPDELYYGVGAAYAGVTRVRIEWPDKTIDDYPVVNGYYVARHVEKRVNRPTNPNARDMQSLPSFFISFYDAAGNLLIRYDHNPSMPIPATCPTDHGC